tara:strand:- start:2 stop:424 length:423 start_codon:yes stop_codon:yes gene_type:complete
MKRLIKRILREEIDKSDKHYRMLDKISDYVQLPYFDSMEGLTIYDEDDQEYILKKIYGDNIKIKGRNIYDDKKLNFRYLEWYGNLIYHESRGDYWAKREYDNDIMISYENSNNEWYIWEYDDKGREIYYEDYGGVIRDNR